jgi:TetR/AcrR family transcriptional regulator, transcriptional repressor for nem operon
MGAGRPKAFEQNDVLDKAIEVFCKKGYEAASTDELLKAMKLGKGSMYHSFGNKRELFSMALDHYLDSFIHDLATELDGAENPIAVIKNFFITVAKEDLAGHKKGCFMGNSVVGLSGIDSGLANSAISKLKALEELFFVHIRRARMNGQMMADTPPKTLARQLITFWNGFNVIRRMYPEQEILLQIIDAEFKILE